MKVIVVFDYPHITDPNSAAADEVVEMLTDATTKWAEEHGADHAYIDDVTKE